MLVPFILMGAYAYYELSLPIVSDEIYDEWCRRLRRVSYRVKHRHLSLVDLSSRIIAGVLLKEEDYPSLVKGATYDWIGRVAYPQLFNR